MLSNVPMYGHVEQVRVRVLNVDSEARKLVLSMRQKPRPPVGEQGDVSKYVAMLEEVRDATYQLLYSPLLPLPQPCSANRTLWEIVLHHRGRYKQTTFRELQ